ncbi:MAG: diaminopimelate epimerase [Deltaproteobacteria bacterium]|nr:diaminopimelate epimerase [Deltaproteobacteria bacterium]
MRNFGSAYKYQGLGNDFVLFDALKSKRLISPKEAVFICNRHFGVGADGVLTLLPSGKADFFMHIYNSDGSVAEMCGNGIRCAVKHYVDFYGDSRRNNPVSVETAKGVQVCEYFRRDKEVDSVTVNMGSPVLEPEKIPVRSDSNIIRITKGNRIVEGMAISMGNPHFVSFGKFAPDDIYSLGPFIEKHPLFPRFTNVELVRVKGKREAEVSVWERGVGITLACGSGSCAVVVAGVIKGLLKPDVFIKVKLPGGVLRVKFDSSLNEVFMNGKAKRVFRIDF